MRFGTETYREGALARLEEARLLLDAERYVYSIYLAGLAVEGMLRSLKWLRDRRFDERHDLRRLATEIERLGLLRTDGRDSDFVATVQGVTKSWSNSLRFAGDEHAAQWFAGRGVSGAKRRRKLASRCREHYLRCFAVVKRCDRLWHEHR